jgi:hypothetical protein
LSRSGQSSLAYNPITLAYNSSKKGEDLKKEDLTSIHRNAVRSSKMYFKGNTYDPIRQKDIAHDKFQDNGISNYLVQMANKSAGELEAKLK